jgi:hypothetical protein
MICKIITVLAFGIHVPNVLAALFRNYERWDSGNFLVSQFEIASTSASSAPNFYSSYTPVTDSNPFVDNSASGQSKLVLEILNGKTEGFFIDLATNDWRVGSNTLSLEQFYNWTGICIEPNEKYFPGILSNRKCTLFINPIFSSMGSAVNFNKWDGLGGIVAPGLDNENRHDSIVTLYTVTLQSLLQELKAPKVIE